MKLVDAVAFQKRKSTKEGNNDESNNFEIEILDEVVLDKALTITEKTLDREKPWRSIYDITDDEYFKQSDVDCIEFMKDFLLKFRL